MFSRKLWGVAAAAAAMLACSGGDTDFADSAAVVQRLEGVQSVEVSLSTPAGVALANTFMSATERLAFSSQARIGEEGATPALANFGSFPTFLQAEARAYGNLYSAPNVQLDAKTVVGGFVRTSGAISKQGVGTSDAPIVLGGEFAGVSVAPHVTSWTVEWPTSHQGNVILLAAPAPRDHVLPSGAYGRFDVHDRNRVFLSSGTYFFESFNTEPQAEIYVDKTNGPVFIYVRNSLSYKGRFVDNGGEEGQVLVGYLGASDAFLQAPFVGTIVAPNAAVKLERPTSGQHKGSFFGKSIEVQGGKHTVLHVPFKFDFLCPLGDSDGDGVFDCWDACHLDPNKVEPGVCGCHEPETDTDGDGVPDCIDECPLDADAQHRGACGCPSDPAPSGTRCADSVCRGVFECNEGKCGDETSCKPHPSCELRYLPRNRHYYWFCDVAVSWDQAAALCGNADGSKLVQIDGAVENAFVAANLTGSMWTGANDRAQSGEWHWSSYVGDVGDKFWTGGASGSSYFARFSAWSGGAPSSEGASCGQISPTGSWTNVGCASPSGFVCEVGTERLTDLDWPVPRPTCELLGFSCDPQGPGEDCVSAADAFGGLSEGEALDAFANCAAVCEAEGQGSQACADACTGPAAPPGPDERCDDAGDFPPGNESCGASTIVTPEIQCSSTSDCPADAVCSREYEGGGAGQPRLCVRPSNSCSGGSPSFPERCQVIDICEPGLTQTVTDVFGPGADLEPIPFNPTEAFGPPQEASSDPYPTEDDPCGGWCSGRGEDHPWCHLGAADETPARPAQEPNKKGHSDGSLISFEFDPKFKLSHSADIGAFGLPELDVTAEAGFSADIVFGLAGGGRFTVIDVLAALDADECGVTSRAALDIFGTDFIDSGVVDVGQYGLPVVFPAEDAQEKCRATLAGLRTAGNRAKKALRDAVELLTQYHARLETPDPNDNFVHFLCRQVAASPPRGFPEGLCPASGTTESPEETINRFVEYYRRTVLGFEGLPGIQGLAEAVAQLRQDAPRISESFGLFSHADFDEQTIASAQFFIGPIPVFLEVISTVDYGVDLTATAEFNVGPVLDTVFRVSGDQAAERVAFVNVEGRPYAGAGLGVFAGVGFGVPGFRAQVGLQADLHLGTIHLPAHAGAGMGLGAKVDSREPPADIAPFATGMNLIPAKRYVTDLQYGAGLGVKLRDVLRGSVSGKLKISVMFFSKTWRQTLLEFNGICSGSPNSNIPGCDFSLISFDGSTNAATGSFPWAEVRMTTPFPELIRLQPGASETGFGGATLGSVERFFYDSLCTCIDGNDPEETRECFRNQDCCSDTPVCFPEPVSQRNVCITCRARGETCNGDSDCCGLSSRTMCNTTSGTCEGLGGCRTPCNRDDECQSDLMCESGQCFGPRCVIR